MLLGLLLACPGATSVDTGPEVDSTPDCPATGDGGFDPATGCALGACEPARHADVAAVYGDAGACVAQGSVVTCTWSALGVSWTFDDCNGDGVPDADGTWCDLYAQRVTLAAPFAGTTSTGLGLGVARSCWEGVYGAPFDYAGEAGWTLSSAPELYQLFVGFDPVGASAITLAYSFEE
jgi:hypothetical protein